MRMGISCRICCPSIRPCTGPTRLVVMPDGTHAARHPTAYIGPVPMVTHVHGAHTHEESDGYPEAWYLPDANNIPAGYATTGTFYD